MDLRAVDIQSESRAHDGSFKPNDPGYVSAEGAPPVPFLSHRALPDFAERTIHAIKDAAVRLRLPLMLNRKTFTYDSCENFALHNLLHSQDALNFQHPAFPHFIILLLRSVRVHGEERT